MVGATSCPVAYHILYAFFSVQLPVRPGRGRVVVLAVVDAQMYCCCDVPVWFAFKPHGIAALFRCIALLAGQVGLTLLTCYM